MIKALIKSDARTASVLKKERASILKEEASLVEMDIILKWEISKIEREKSGVSEEQYGLMLQDMDRLRTEWSHRTEDLCYRKEMYAVQVGGLSDVSKVEGKTSKVSGLLRQAWEDIVQSDVIFATMTFGGVLLVVLGANWIIQLIL